MGIYDRDYYQGERPTGIQLGGQWSMVGKLIAINVAVYLVDIFTRQGSAEALQESHWMAAGPMSLANPWYAWQLVTYAFAHGTQPSHIIGNMFLLFIFGREVEGIYGPKEFLRFYLTAAVLGGLVFSTRLMATVPSELWGNYSVVGASGAVTAVLLLFCIHFPKRTLLLFFVLPVPAWVFALLFVGGDIAGYLNPNRQGIAFDVHLAGAAFAAVYFKLKWNLGRVFPSFSGTKGWFKPKPKLKIHEPMSEDPYRTLDAKADVILDKVKRDGVGSLSESERRVLEDYSRRMRRKHS